MIESDFSKPCVGLCKWRMEVKAVPVDSLVCQSTWKKYRGEKINHFLWQLVHRINAMKHYIGVGLLGDLLMEQLFLFLRWIQSGGVVNLKRRPVRILFTASGPVQILKRIWLWIQMLIQEALVDCSSSSCFGCTFIWGYQGCSS